MEREELQRAIEAILFAAGERIEASRLAMALETDIDEVIAAADDLSKSQRAGGDHAAIDGTGHQSLCVIGTLFVPQLGETFSSQASSMSRHRRM